MMCSNRHVSCDGSRDYHVIQVPDRCQMDETMEKVHRLRDMGPILLWTAVLLPWTSGH